MSMWIWVIGILEIAYAVWQFHCMYMDSKREGDPRIGERQMRRIREYVLADQLIYGEARGRYELNGRLSLGHYGSNSERSIFLVRGGVGDSIDPLRGRTSTEHDVILLRCFGWGADWDACGFPKERVYSTFDEAWKDLTGRDAPIGWRPAPAQAIQQPSQEQVSPSPTIPIIPETSPGR